MSAYIKTFNDNNGDIVYPKTKTEAVYLKDGTLLSDFLNTKVNTSDVYTKEEAYNIIMVDETEEI